MTAITRAALLAVGLAVAGAGMATAGQQRPYRVSDQQLKDLVNRIDTHEQAFRSSFERAIDRSPIKNSPTADQAGRSMKDFNEAADQLRDRVNDGQSVTSDAENLLRRASAIDSLMTRTQFEAPAQRDWQALRLDMNDLTRAYGIAWNWSAASQTMPARVNDNQIKQLLKTIGQKADTFDKGLDRAFVNSTYDAGRGKRRDPPVRQRPQAGNRSIARSRQWAPGQHARRRGSAPPRREHRQLHAAVSVERPGGAELGRAARRSGQARQRLQRRAGLERFGIPVGGAGLPAAPHRNVPARRRPQRRSAADGGTGIPRGGT